ncbi:sulfatase-like hydrolase/transferase [Algoriphagus sp. AK58]|uniref:sulfatase-like hydrolase/transferase n=1 Tax=Algoriphagus sp. AK58 TaxID=1406877 RepID=UPI0016500D88|nr:sulfatase-like hydrolase/transferase [Algoriphagus sp. AK58]MBC6366888.1 choline-sulfatase [Algoriphagus sp. AK58]
MKNYLLLFLAFLAWSCQEKKPVQPNILFLFADDQRADALGISGNPFLQTPTIDHLALNGVRFTNTYVMGGHHGAICMASRAMLFSGKQLFQVYDRLQGLETMTMDFAKAGYTTFGTGKWHNEKEAFETSFQQAKNVFLGGMADHYAVAVRDYDSLGRLGNPKIKGYSTDIFTQSAIEFIQSQKDSDNPFFCYVAFTVPHDPYSPKPDHIGDYPDGSISLPANYLPLHPFQFDDLIVRDENLTGWPRKPEVIQMILSDYYSMITDLDTQISKIIATLKETGKFENTIIVYAADNGLAAGSHGLLGKQSLYEHSIKVPLIIQGPGIPKNKSFDAFAYIHDIYPTLAELAGLPKREDLDGKSLVPVIDGEQEEIREVMFNAYRHTVRSVRKENWKLIRYPERDFTQLFDLATDPQEMTNLADDPSLAETKNELISLLEKSQSSAGDTISFTAKTIKPLAYNPDTLVRKPDQWQPPYILKRYFDQ